MAREMGESCCGETGQESGGDAETQEKQPAHERKSRHGRLADHGVQKTQGRTAELVEILNDD